MSRELGPITILGADAVGQPGQRRFRLFALGTRSAVMWMEKEQLNSLSIELDRALAFITEGQVLRTEAKAGGPEAPTHMPTDFPPFPNYEFQAGHMQLQYNQLDNTFRLEVIPLQISREQGQEPEVVLREEDAVILDFTPQQAQDLSSSISAVVVAGRPVCPLCHTPLDGGPHACVKQNGHRQVVSIEDSEDEV